jgi:hypothetical protein
VGVPRQHLILGSKVLSGGTPEYTLGVERIFHLALFEENLPAS